MHIPKETLGSYLTDKGQKSLIESPRADLVAGSTNIRAALANTNQERNNNVDKENGASPSAP